MPKIDKDQLYNHLVKLEHDVTEKLNEYDAGEHISVDNYIEKLLFMRELNTISLIRYIVADFPEVK